MSPLEIIALAAFDKLARWVAALSRDPGYGVGHEVRLHRSVQNIFMRSTYSPILGDRRGGRWHLCRILRRQDRVGR